jgi:hypothetical protein
LRTIIHEEDVPNAQISYRWRLPDAVRFNKKIRVTLEHGHPNHLRDDWSTTAYWYQTLPSPKLPLLPVEKRLPRRPEFPADSPLPAPSSEHLTHLQCKNIKQRDERMKAFVDDRNQWLERRAEASRERAKSNVEIAKDIRKRFLENLKEKCCGRSILSENKFCRSYIAEAL